MTRHTRTRAATKLAPCDFVKGGDPDDPLSGESYCGRCGYPYSNARHHTTPKTPAATPADASNEPAELWYQR